MLKVAPPRGDFQGEGPLAREEVGNPPRRSGRGAETGQAAQMVKTPESGESDGELQLSALTGSPSLHIRARNGEQKADRTQGRTFRSNTDGSEDERRPPRDGRCLLRGDWSGKCQ